MYTRIVIRILCIACLLANQPAMCYAGGSQVQPSTAPCTYQQARGYSTKYGLVTFRKAPQNGGTRWICYNDNVLLETRTGGNGGQYYYNWETEDFENEPLKEAAVSVMKNGELVRYAVLKDGQPMMSRMIVKEDTGLDGDHHYWLLDFRGKEPIVAGPMGNNDVSRIYSVIWNDQSVILILDDDGGPRGGNNSDWSRNAYQYVDKVLMEEDGEDATEELALIRKNNKKVDHDETIEVFDAYLYDYRKNRIIKTDIEKEKPVAKIKKKKSAK